MPLYKPRTDSPRAFLPSHTWNSVRGDQKPQPAYSRVITERGQVESVQNHGWSLAALQTIPCLLSRCLPLRHTDLCQLTLNLLFFLSCSTEHPPSKVMGTNLGWLLHKPRGKMHREAGGSRIWARGISRLELSEFQIRACFALFLIAIAIIPNHLIAFFQFRRTSLFAFRENTGTSLDKHLPSKNSMDLKKGTVPSTGDSYRD